MRKVCYRKAACSQQEMITKKEMRNHKNNVEPNHFSLGFSGGTVVKNLPAFAGDARDAGLISGLGRSPGGGHSNPYQFLPGESPWTEEPGSLQSIGLQRVRRD